MFVTKSNKSLYEVALAMFKLNHGFKCCLRGLIKWQSLLIANMDV